jgi:hypothetical protein
MARAAVDEFCPGFYVFLVVLRSMRIEAHENGTFRY